MMVSLQLFVGRTRIGRSMRSTALDRDAAALMGVNINRTIAITFLIGSALAGAAGVTFGLQYGVTNSQLGFNAGLRAFTAAVLGRHRQHRRRRARRVHHRVHRGGCSGRGLQPLGPRDRVRRPRHRAGVPPIGPARPAHGRPGMSAVTELPAKAAAPSPRDRLRELARNHRSTTILAGMALIGLLLPILAYFPPFTLFQSQIAWVDGFSNAGVFVLLAIGLNIVVGVAGLLDLGLRGLLRDRVVRLRVCGLAVRQPDPRHQPRGAPRRRGRDRVLADADHRRPRRRCVRHPAGRADPPAARRLSRDRDPRVRRDRADRVPRGVDGHQRHQRHRRRPPALAAGARHILRSQPAALLHHHRGAGRGRAGVRVPVGGESESAAPGRRSARTSWPRPRTASTPSRPSCWRSRSARRRRASPASTTPRS